MLGRDRTMLGSDMVYETNEVVEMIKLRIKVDWDGLKSYIGGRHKFVELYVGDLIYINISPIKGEMRCGFNKKLSPKCMGPFPISKGMVAYHVQFLDNLEGTHIYSTYQCSE